MTRYSKINSLWHRDSETHKVLFHRICEPFGALYDCLWDVTEKVDGTNIRIIYKDGIRDIRGRGDNANIPGPLLRMLQDSFPAESVVGDMCIYGEGFGPGIQKGGKYGSKPMFAAFDIRIGDIWLERQTVLDIVEGHFQATVVPHLGQYRIGAAIDMVKNVLLSKWGSFTAEGIVLTPVGGLLDRKGHRIITKIKADHFS